MADIILIIRDICNIYLVTTEEVIIAEHATIWGYIVTVFAFLRRWRTEIPRVLTTPICEAFSSGDGGDWHAMERDPPHCSLYF